MQIIIVFYAKVKANNVQRCNRHFFCRDYGTAKYLRSYTLPHKITLDNAKLMDGSIDNKNVNLIFFHFTASITYVTGEIYRWQGRNYSLDSLLMTNVDKIFRYTYQWTHITYQSFTNKQPQTVRTTLWHFFFNWCYLT